MVIEGCSTWLFCNVFFVKKTCSSLLLIKGRRQGERLFIALNRPIFQRLWLQKLLLLLVYLTKYPEGAALLFVDLLGFF